MRELFCIIPKLPGVRVYEFAKDKRSSQELVNFCKEKDHYIELVALDDRLFEEIKELEATKVRKIDENKERFNQRAYQYDTIFINYPLKNIKDLDQFFRKIYRMTKNAGDIVFEIEEDRVEEFTKFLEELNFVAINPIKSENKTYLTAKKLHGWAKV